MEKGDAIGKRIATYRKMRALSQHQLAAAAEVSYSMISKVESGHASASPAMIGMIARGLRLDASRLYGNDEQQQTLDLAPVIRRTLAAVDLMAEGVERALPPEVGHGVCDYAANVMLSAA